ncbi:MAG: LytR C-terminal domain-containing protein, partial [Mycobacteriales bacterium]
ITSSPSPSTTAATTHPLPTPSLRPTRPPASRTAMAAVRVYNSTHITGLAHHVAAEVAQRGWTVPAVGNVSNALPATTVFYSPSARAAAQHLAREFSGIRRLQPNSSLGIHFHGLTLVLTADWHD